MAKNTADDSTDHRARRPGDDKACARPEYCTDRIGL
jgi:hypothetical protein